MCAYRNATGGTVYEDTYDRELNIRRAELAAPVVDVRDPLLVVGQAVRGEPNELHVALLEVRRPADHRGGISLFSRWRDGSSTVDLPPRDLSKLRGADGGEITRVGEEDGLECRGG